MRGAGHRGSGPAGGILSRVGTNGPAGEVFLVLVAAVDVIPFLDDDGPPVLAGRPLGRLHAGLLQWVLRRLPHPVAVHWGRLLGHLDRRPRGRPAWSLEEAEGAAEAGSGALAATFLPLPSYVPPLLVLDQPCRFFPRAH